MVPQSSSTRPAATPPAAATAAAPAAAAAAGGGFCGGACLQAAHAAAELRGGARRAAQCSSSGGLLLGALSAALLLMLAAEGPVSLSLPLSSSQLRAAARGDATGGASGASAACALRASDWLRVSSRVSSSYQRDETWPQFASARQAACSGGSQASAAALRRLVQRIGAARAFSVVAIGGSAPAGVDCANELVETKDCAWPGRFVDGLRAVFRETDFAFTSHASGGMNQRSALASLPFWLSTPPDSDLLLVDFHINDVLGGEEPADILGHVESLILAARRLRPSLEILYVGSMCDHIGAGVNTVYRAAAAAHGVPFVSFFDLVSAVGFVRAPGEEEVQPRSKHAYGVGPWCDQTSHWHPTWPLHQLIADSALGCVEAAWAELCGKPAAIAGATTLSLPTMLSNVSCEVPTVFISAQREWELASSGSGRANSAGAGAVSPVVRSSEWGLLEDRKGKPGWVASSPKAFIEFDLHFGARPRLAISYLQSYRGLGAAVVRFQSRPDRSITLDGLFGLLDPQFALRVSQTTALMMEVDNNDFHADRVTTKKPHGLAGQLGFGFPPFHSDTIRFEAAPNRESGAFKFKIISLTAC